MEMLTKIGSALWGTPTVIALTAVGLWLSAAEGFLPVRRLGFALRRCFSGLLRRGEGGTSALEAVCTALAGTVGTGNIAGVVIALTLGGPGAVLWMWVSALVGMGVKYAEIALAVRFRERRGGEWVGGPMVTVKNGLGPRFRVLAVLFCIFGAGASFGIGNLMQMGAVKGLVGDRLPAWALGAGMALLVLLTCRGGAAGRGRAAALLVPVMAGLYVCGALAVIGAHLERLPWALREIVVGALSPRAAAGGVSGLSARQALSAGFRRGMFSNEAGLGSSPIAHASAAARSPGEQGLFGIFEVFADTCVLCTLTALMVLTSGVPLRFGVPAGAEVCAGALATVFGRRVSGAFMGLCMGLFAFSSIVGWSLYGERCVQFLAGDRGAGVYRVLFAAVTFAGAFPELTFIIGISDIFNALMALPNLISLLLLTPEICRLTQDFFQKIDNYPIACYRNLK